MAGKYFDELYVGMKFRHAVGRTVTETDNVLFNSLTMNTQPLHMNADFASRAEYGRPIVNGLLTLAMVVGISVGDLTEGTIVANLGYGNVKHPKPVFPGDTLYVESEVLDRRESRSRPDQGIVKLRHVGRNQHRQIVCEVERTVLFLKRNA